MCLVSKKLFIPLALRSRVKTSPEHLLNLNLVVSVSASLYTCKYPASVPPSVYFLQLLLLFNCVVSNTDGSIQVV